MTAILVVEDDEILCGAMVSLFKRCGYTVYSASSGNQAIDILDTQQGIEVVISDYYMADGSGHRLLEHVKNLPVVRPFFVLITGHADLTDKEVEALGVDQLLVKPFPIKELVNVVSRALGAGAHSPS